MFWSFRSIPSDLPGQVLTPYGWMTSRWIASRRMASHTPYDAEACCPKASEFSIASLLSVFAHCDVRLLSHKSLKLDEGHGSDAFCSVPSDDFAKAKTLQLFCEIG